MPDPLPEIRPLTAEQEADLARLLATAAAIPRPPPAHAGTHERGSHPPYPRLWQPPKRLRTRQRCTARRSDGQPCRAWAIHGGWVCAAHGGRAPQVAQAARERLERAALTGYAMRMADRMETEREEAADLLGAELEAFTAHYWPRSRGEPARCRYLFGDGRACRAWAVRGGYLCVSHGGVPAPKPRRRLPDPARLVARATLRAWNRAHQGQREPPGPAPDRAGYSLLGVRPGGGTGERPGQGGEGG